MEAGAITTHRHIVFSLPFLGQPRASVRGSGPGQEEGNLELLRRIGAGDLAETGPALAAALRDLLSDQASPWHKQKQRLALHARPAASRIVASFVLELAAKAQSSPVPD